MRTQFNTRICKNLLRKVATDRKNHGVTNDIVVEVALDDFFSRLTPDQRSQFYRQHRRPYARNS